LSSRLGRLVRKRSSSGGKFTKNLFEEERPRKKPKRVFIRKNRGGSYQALSSGKEKNEPDRVVEHVLQEKTPHERQRTKAGRHQHVRRFSGRKKRFC